MSILSYKTRGDSSPQGKERVYFTCHPQDFSVYFDDVCDDILATQNCAIYYRENYQITSPDDNLEDLALMQLFVIPITSRFLLEENFSRCKELHFAKQHNIPVLPLMQEDNLASLFNSVCGEFQYLDKHAQDVTALPYKDKLEVFLKNVLCGDKLATRIRNAFDAYIFLSYRKKDRKYAQELMKLIHQVPACRDIAIWYDEFLVPGENFNSGIADALNKSQLVVMNVTPNMVNEPNYIITTEYPAAVNAQKPIVAVQMVKTEQCLLDKNYPNIPKSVDGFCKDKLQTALLDGLSLLNDLSNDNEAEHLYLIGLAYLNGIDVEIDVQRGLELVTLSAEKGNVEAMECLSNLYLVGKATTYDGEKSAYWQEKAVDCLQKKFEDETTLQNALQLLDAYNTLGTRYLVTGNIDKSHQRMLQCLPICEKIVNLFDEESCYEFLASTYHALATLCNIKRLQEANLYADKALQLYSILEEKNPTAKHKSQLAEALMAKAVALEKTDFGKTLQMAENVLQLRQELVALDNSAHERMWLGFAHNYLGKCLASKGNFAIAKQHFEQALKISDALVEEQRKVSAVALFMQSLNNMGMCLQHLGDVNKAKKYLERCVEWGYWLTETCKLSFYLDSIATTQLNIAILCIEQEDLLSAKQWADKGVTLRLQTLGDKQDLKHLFDCANACLVKADICKKLSDTQEQTASLEHCAVLLQQAMQITPLPYGKMLVGVCMQLIEAYLQREDTQMCSQAITKAKQAQKVVCQNSNDLQDKTSYLSICIDYLTLHCSNLPIAIQVLGEMASVLKELRNALPHEQTLALMEETLDLVRYLQEDFESRCTVADKLNFADVLLDIFTLSNDEDILQYACNLIIQVAQQEPSNQKAMSLVDKAQQILGD